MKTNEIICGECEQELKQFPNECIDLTVTSPPYDQLRDYNGYLFDFEGVAKQLLRITKTRGIVVWVVGDSIVNGSESGTSFRQALYFKQIGFNLHDTMIYKKEGSALPDPTRYGQRFEYMFVLSRGKPKTFNPITDVKNKYVGVFSGGVVREKDGITYPRKKRIIPEFSRRSNIWSYSTGYMNTTKDKFAYKHPAMFPEKLAKDHIISWSNEGDLVLDPFAGSGTTLKMAKLLNRNYIGIEISKDYCDIIQKRLSKYNNEKLEMFFNINKEKQ